MTLDELSSAVNSWCDSHGISPASGQAAEAISERTVRYYRTLSLVDAPESGVYSEKHYLQLVAIKLLQAQGAPLRRIRELLFGRSIEQLREIERRGVQEAKTQQQTPPTFPSADELWRMIPLDEHFLLVSRNGHVLTSAQREAILSILKS